MECVPGNSTTFYLSESQLSEAEKRKPESSYGVRKGEGEVNKATERRRRGNSLFTLSYYCRTKVNIRLAKHRNSLLKPPGGGVLRNVSSLDRSEVSKGLQCVGSISLKGFDLCVLKHQIVSRRGLKIVPAVPEPLLCAVIMLGYEDLYTQLLYI